MFKRKPIEYETEGYSEDKPVDTVWIRNEDGKMVQLEVEDDVADDQA